MSAMGRVRNRNGGAERSNPKNKSGGKTKRSRAKKKTKGDSSATKYKIPKDVFEKALRGIRDDKPSENLHCLTPTYLISDRKSEVTKCSFATILSLCRLYLQTRDFDNLARALSTTKFAKAYDLDRYFPTFLKYAVILLKHKQNSELLDCLLRRVCRKEENIDEFWNRLSRII